MGMFAAPNTASIMNAAPARERGVASGMRVTFGNAGMPLSMGLFFTLMVVGLNAKVPAAMFGGLTSHGVPAAVAGPVSHLPPLGYLFASLLGYNPLAKLLGPHVLSHLPAHQAAVLTSRSFFPQLIGAPFKHGLVLILSFAAAMSLIAAVASLLRGGRFVHAEAGSTIGDGRATPALAAQPAAAVLGGSAPAQPAAAAPASASSVSVNGDTPGVNGDTPGVNGDTPGDRARSGNGYSASSGNGDPASAAEPGAADSGPPPQPSPT